MTSPRDLSIEELLNPPIDEIHQYIMTCDKCNCCITITQRGYSLSTKLLTELLGWIHTDREYHQNYYAYFSHYNIIVDTVIEGNQICKN